MQRETENTTMETVLRLLYHPIPYLPEMSFLERGRTQQRKQRALEKIKNKAPTERKVRGNIELLGKGKCKICGHSVEINESTWIFGDIKNGSIAEMTLVEKGDGFIAKRVVII